MAILYGFTGVFTRQLQQHVQNVQPLPLLRCWKTPKLPQDGTGILELPGTVHATCIYNICDHDTPKSEFFGTENAFIRNAGSLDSPEEAEFEARSVTLGPRSWMVGSFKVQLFPRCQVNITEEGVIREAEACEDS